MTSSIQDPSPQAATVNTHTNADSETRSIQCSTEPSRLSAIEAIACRSEGVGERLTPPYAETQLRAPSHQPLTALAAVNSQCETISTQSIIDSAHQQKHRYPLNTKVDFQRLKKRFLSKKIGLIQPFQRSRNGNAKRSSASKRSGHKSRGRQQASQAAIPNNTLSLTIQTMLNQWSRTVCYVKGSAAERLANGESIDQQRPMDRSAEQVHSSNKPLHDIDFALPVETIDVKAIQARVGKLLKHSNSALKPFSDQAVFDAYTYGHKEIAGGYKFTLMVHQPLASTPSEPPLTLDFLFYTQLAAEFDSITSGIRLEIDLNEQRAELKRPIDEVTESFMSKHGLIWFNENIENPLQRLHYRFEKQPSITLLQPNIVEMLYQSSTPKEQVLSIFHLLTKPCFADRNHCLWQSLIEHAQDYLQTTLQAYQDNNGLTVESTPATAEHAFSTQLMDWMQTHPDLADLQTWISVCQSVKEDLKALLTSKQPLLDKLVKRAPELFPVVSLDTLITCWQEAEQKANSVLSRLLLPATFDCLTAPPSEHSEPLSKKALIVQMHQQRFLGQPLQELSTLAQLVKHQYRNHERLSKRALSLLISLLPTAQSQPDQLLKAFTLCRDVKFKESHQKAFVERLFQDASVNTPRPSSALLDMPEIDALIQFHRYKSLLDECGRNRSSLIEGDKADEIRCKLVMLKEQVERVDQCASLDEQQRLPWSVALPCVVSGREADGTHYSVSHLANQYVLSDDFAESDTTESSQRYSVFYCGPVKSKKPYQHGLALVEGRSVVQTPSLFQGELSSIHPTKACIYFASGAHYQGETLAGLAEGEGTITYHFQALPNPMKAIVQKLCGKSQTHPSKKIEIQGAFHENRLISGVLTTPVDAKHQAGGKNRAHPERLSIVINMAEVDQVLIENFNNENNTLTLPVSEAGELQLGSATINNEVMNYTIRGRVNLASRSIEGFGEFTGPSYRFTGPLKSSIPHGKGEVILPWGDVVKTQAFHGTLIDPLLDDFERFFMQGRGKAIVKQGNIHWDKTPYQLPTQLTRAFFSLYTSDHYALIGAWNANRAHVNMFKMVPVVGANGVQKSLVRYKGELVFINRDDLDKIKTRWNLPTLNAENDDVVVRLDRGRECFALPHRLGVSYAAGHSNPAPYFAGIALRSSAEPCQTRPPIDPSSRLFHVKTPFYSDAGDSYLVTRVNKMEGADYLGEIKFLANVADQTMTIEPHGKGVVYFKGLIKGTFDRGLLHGESELYLDHGVFVNALFKQGYLRHATLEFRSGAQMSAHFVNNMIQGVTTFTDAVGQHYYCEFEKNHPQQGVKVDESFQGEEVESIDQLFEALEINVGDITPLIVVAEFLRLLAPRAGR